MIEGLQPYAEYKESGLPWLGRCPDHWKVRRTKILFQERVQKGFPNEPLLAATQTKGVVRKEDYETRTVTAQKDLHLLKLVETGDYVISLRSFQGGIEVAHYRGIISPAYTVLKPRGEAKSGYYSKFFKSRQFIDSLSLFVTGIREGQNIDYERMSRAEMPCPPPDEQAAIVRFLDHANRKIDGFIRAKRKLIALLGEQKQAIIHRAVTRGLDPNAPLKPSGIPWLGDIPQHWEVRRIKYLLREVDNRSATGKEQLLSMRMHHGLVVFAEHFSRPPQAATLVGFKIVKPRQFVVNRMQAGNGVIFPSCLNITGLVSPDYAVFDPIADVNVDYLGELFRTRTVRTKFRAESKGLGTGTSGFMRLYNDRFGAIHIPLPPRADQDAILKGLGEELSDLNAAIARTEREIALMQEYRTRLTADVVTGKLDVRPAAANLSEEAEGTEETLDTTTGDEGESTEELETTLP
ncbi:MAG: restriction endonuclease subunit S [Chthoniobacterales bacterium]|nr:restriction endonuclease subunit S [Chthoniobacterales bacterium]